MENLKAFTALVIPAAPLSTLFDNQGVLGEDFLGRFDMLIDNAHGVMSLEEPGTMLAPVKRQQAALLTSSTTILVPRRTDW